MKTKTSKIQRTFCEDTELGIVLNWVDEIVWSHSYQTQPRDPADIESRLSNKIRVKIEIIKDNENKDT